MVEFRPAEAVPAVDVLPFRLHSLARIDVDGLEFMAGPKKRSGAAAARDRGLPPRCVVLSERRGPRKPIRGASRCKRSGRHPQMQGLSD